MEPKPPQLPSDADASGRDLGDQEIALVAEAIRSGTLTSTKGVFVRRLERAFAESMGSTHAVACASGTAAVHAAVAAAGLSAGDIAGAGARVLGGGGSRDPELSQAGGPNGAEIDAAVAQAASAAQEALAAL